MQTGRIVIQLEHREDTYNIPFGGRVVIGRSSSADIQIPAPSVSKLHCRITHRHDKFLLEDLNSRNFTYLNGEKISAVEVLHNADLITAGRVDITFLTGVSEDTESETIDCSQGDLPSVVSDTTNISPVFSGTETSQDSNVDKTANISPAFSGTETSQDSNVDKTTNISPVFSGTETSQNLQVTNSYRPHQEENPVSKSSPTMPYDVAPNNHNILEETVSKLPVIDDLADTKNRIMDIPPVNATNSHTNNQQSPHILSATHAPNTISTPPERGDLNQTANKQRITGAFSSTKNRLRPDIKANDALQKTNNRRLKTDAFANTKSRVAPQANDSVVKQNPIMASSIPTTSLLETATSPEDAMLISILLSNGESGITSSQIAECLRIQKKYAQYSLAQIIVKKGYIDVEQMKSTLKTISGILKFEQTDVRSNSGRYKVAEPEPTTPKSDDKNLQKLFIKIIRARGFITQEQLKRCMMLHQKYVSGGVSIKFLDLLIREKYLTKEQINDCWKFVSGDIPYQIDGYEMISLIGLGGMGYIYKAKQISMDRLVAIKILSEEYSGNPNLNELFLKEARAVARLNHENIISGYDFGRKGDFCFFVMEYVDGISLYEKLKSSGDKLPITEGLDVIIQVTKALDHASARGFVHRDIKPENVLIKKDGVAKLCDLGLAEKVNEQKKKEQEFGTPAFMSPEQIRCEPNIDIRSDIYSLGITFFRVVYGKLPFRGSTREIMAKHLTEKVTFPEEPGSFREKKVMQIIEKMMTKEKDDRYQTPNELLKDLQEAKNPDMVQLSQTNMKSIDATVAIPKLSRRRKLALKRRRRRR